MSWIPITGVILMWLAIGISLLLLLLPNLLKPKTRKAPIPEERPGR